MTDSGIRERIDGDRRRARILARLAIVPITVVFAVLLYVASFVTQYLGPFEFARVLALATPVCAVVGYWNFQFVHAVFMRQRIQAIWLRRFQAEGGKAFRASRVIDRLARQGISTLTLQDRDVQLSMEQRRQRLAPMFWAVAVPLTGGLAALSFSSWQAVLASTTREGFTMLGQLFIVNEALIVIGAIVVAAILLAAIAGPIVTFMFRHRDDSAKLPRLMRRLIAGRRTRGTAVLRISDINWREAVTTALSAMDLAIVDVSTVTDHIAWEIHHAIDVCGGAGLVFICKEDSRRLSPLAVEMVRDVAGRRLDEIVYYPETRGDRRRSEAFALALRGAIYTAADRRSASRRDSAGLRSAKSPSRRNHG
jgi:hypothetical protein